MKKGVKERRNMDSHIQPLANSISSVELLSRVRLFKTPRATARQASLSNTNSRNLPKLMSIESVMPSSHLILCRPLGKFTRFLWARFPSEDAIAKHCVRISPTEVSDGGLYLGFNILHDVHLSCTPTSWKIHHTRIDSFPLCPLKMLISLLTPGFSHIVFPCLPPTSAFDPLNLQSPALKQFLWEASPGLHSLQAIVTSM